MNGDVLLILLGGIIVFFDAYHIKFRWTLNNDH